MRKLHEFLHALRDKRVPESAERNDEDGMTGLETAIILIAFVVVAAVFAFVILSTGLFASERSKESVFAGLAKTRGTMELTGGVIASTNGTDVTQVTLALTLAGAGDSVNLRYTDPINRTVISYIDNSQIIPDLSYTSATITGTPDGLLQQGELMTITVDFTTQTTPITLGPNVTFVLEVKPPTGSYLVIQRTTPPGLAQTVIDLY